MSRKLLVPTLVKVRRRTGPELPGRALARLTHTLSGHFYQLLHESRASKKFRMKFSLGVGVVDDSFSVPCKLPCRATVAPQIELSTVTFQLQLTSSCCVRAKHWKTADGNLLKVNGDDVEKARVACFSNSVVFHRRPTITRRRGNRKQCAQIRAVEPSRWKQHGNAREHRVSRRKAECSMTDPQCSCCCWLGKCSPLQQQTLLKLVVPTFRII